MGIQRSGLQHSAGWHGERFKACMTRWPNVSTVRLFLAFGHPEGFGPPIADTLAVAGGYSGGGGRELFRFGASEEVAFGDWPGFVAALQRALTSFAEQPRETQFRLERQALAVRSLYSHTQERASINAAWQRIEQAYLQWRQTPLANELTP